MTPTRVSCAIPRSMALCFIALNLLLGKNLPLIDQLIHLWQRPNHPHQTIFLHRTLQIQICSTSAPLRAMLILGVAKWADKALILAGIAHGFHLVNDLSIVSPMDCHNYRSAENPAVKPALDKLFQDELCFHRI